MPEKLDKLLKQLINLHPKYIDLSLDRLLNLLKKLQNPHLDLPPTIHIAGTNGKGSTLSYIRHILMENKLYVHSYISPHLKFFNERIILANNQVSTKKLLNTLKLVKDINKQEPITFFEITTAAALYMFSKEKADFLILETGLGGRLDATNVITKSLIDIITPISIDHQEFLGENILKITNEKLGIIKKNSNVIISKQKKIVTAHIKRRLINKKNTKLFYNKDFKIIEIKNKKFTLEYKGILENYNLPNLAGEHQIENVSTAITSILRLNELGYFFSKRTINNGIIKTKWPGRLEKMKFKNANIYLDGAHNTDGAKQLLKFFTNKKIKVWLIIGMLNNKKISDFLKIVKPILNGVIAIPIPNEKNSFKPCEIIKISNHLKLQSYTKQTINEANNLLIKKIKAKNILISGSLYLIGNIRNKYL